MAFYRITEKIFQGKRPITGINMLIVAKAFAPSRNNNRNCLTGKMKVHLIKKLKHGESAAACQA